MDLDGGSAIWNAQLWGTSLLGDNRSVEDCVGKVLEDSLDVSISALSTVQRPELKSHGLS